MLCDDKIACVRCTRSCVRIKNISVFLCFVIVVNVCNLIFLFGCSVVVCASLHFFGQKKSDTMAQLRETEKTALAILRTTYLFSCVSRLKVESSRFSSLYLCFLFSIACVFFAFSMFRVRDATKKT